MRSHQAPPPGEASRESAMMVEGQRSPPSELQDEEDESAAADAWLLDSLSLYNDLHLFELQDPTRIIEWTGEKSICVAGYENGRRNEILQLRLPQRLCAKVDQGLCPERDFKVEYGGFSDRPVYMLKHIPETSLLVTSGPSGSSLQVWHVEKNETDVIKHISSIPTAQGDGLSWAKIATPPSKSAWVLHGQRTDNIQVTEIESRKTVFTAASASSDEIATLEFLDKATLLACGAQGQLLLADTREPQGHLAAVADTPLPSAVGEQRWCAGIRRSAPDSVAEMPLVARLSSGGHVVLTDLRNPAGPLKAAQGCLPTPAPSGAEFLCVSFAPLLGECLAVSGFDATVQVYDTRTWEPRGQEAQPLFIHKGHLFSSTADAGKPPLVAVHGWHPCKPRTLLSAASDGSLHVWDWRDHATTS